MEQGFLVVLCHKSDRVYKVKRVNRPLMDDFNARRDEEKERDKRAKEADLCRICCAGKCHGRTGAAYRRRAHTSKYSCTESAS
jgi:hypothetical protein